MAKKGKKKAAKKKSKPKPQVTARTRYVAFRLPHRTLAAIEQYREWLSEGFGLAVNRTTALVHLVGRCWEQVKLERRSPRKPSAGK